ncbi:EscU/YscU/HrcU family type III secretion system export apparatus switch protein [Halomonas binhaiensis]|uniref:Flagellar biosynthetic protein FlhB n=1 Tax=Halomonas binhaiensis TaxID=2562282 RepID=A0A5C1NMX2_9GAMM|nr:EscU/YscU/HrcU family type III secretion system export apparatus switch protein [Halomonas binhaiensis]QEM83798.1 EscU/YscU/HrcU family type III secretion system export apparatus switch protein [Halomonas binhaiensis]
MAHPDSPSSGFRSSPQQHLSSPPRQALALGYAPDSDDAPRVLAKGYGELADRIIAEARLHDIYVHDEPELVGLLMQLDLDEQIPPRLYHVIAEILIWVMELDNAASGTQENNK